VREAIELPFEVVSGVCPGIGILDEGSDPPWEMGGFGGFSCQFVCTAFENALVTEKRI